MLFSIVVGPIYIPTNSAPGFPLHYILADTCCLLSFEVVSHCGFDLHFPDVEHPLMCLLANLMSSLEKYLFSLPPPHLSWMVCVFVIKLYEFFTHFGLTFIQYTVCKNFLPIFWLSFHSVNCFFSCAEVFEFADFCFCCLCFWCHIQETIAKTRVEGLLLRVLWYWVLCLSLWSISG